jgi:hypothetical protein
MDPTAIIASYAALVATGAAAVQLAQWRASRTRLKLKANAGTAPILTESRDIYGNKVSAAGEVLFLHLTKPSPHHVKVTHLGAATAGRRGLAFVRPYPLHLELPIEIPARDTVTLWQPRGDLASWETARMRIVVRTAAGEDFRSRPFCMAQLSRFELLA